MRLEANGSSFRPPCIIHSQALIGLQPMVLLISFFDFSFVAPSIIMELPRSSRRISSSFPRAKNVDCSMTRKARRDIRDAIQRDTIIQSSLSPSSSIIIQNPKFSSSFGLTRNVKRLRTSNKRTRLMETSRIRHDIHLPWQLTAIKSNSTPSQPHTHPPTSLLKCSKSLLVLDLIKRTESTGPTD
jgi:hypothetical protein